MQTVEFNAAIENGVIPIPQQYRDTLTDDVRVILIPKERILSKPENKKIYSIGINMTGYKFDREEANERR